MPLLFNMILEDLVRAVRQENETLLHGIRTIYKVVLSPRLNTVGDVNGAGDRPLYITDAPYIL